MTETLAPGAAAAFPCSPTQVQFLALDQLGAGRTALNFAFRYQVNGPLRLPLLQQAFDQLLQRHEILRTCFSPVGASWQQDVFATVSVPIAAVDLSHLSTEAAEVEALELGRREAERPFDLTRAPLLRLSMLRLDAQRHILLFTTHATIIDGWSIGILVAELGRLISAFDSGREPGLAAVEIPFGDFARWQHAVAASGGFDDDLKYWRAELQGIADFRVPATKPAPAVRRFPSLTRGNILDRTLTDKVSAVARRDGVTFFHIALAALTSALYAQTGSPEIVLGTQVSGRTEQDAENIVGPVLNPLVLRLPIPDVATGAGLIECAQRVSSEALLHQSVPFATVVEVVAPEQRQQRNPLYAVNFALQAAFIHEDTIQARDNGAFAIHSLPSASHAALWDLNFGLVERPNGWRMSCEADGDLYTAAAIDALLMAWSDALLAVVERPDAVISPPAAIHITADPTAASLLADNPGKPASSEVHTLPQAARKPVVRAPRLAVSRPDFIGDRITVYQPQATGLPIMALNVTSLFYPLATFDPERAFYDIQLTDDVAPAHFEPRAIGDLAADAVRLIQQARPKGPYVLLAYCVSGAVAMEAARQLRAQGAAVPLVVLIDTWRPGFREDLTHFEKRLRRMSFLLFRFSLDRERVKSGRMTWPQAIKRLRLVAPLRRLLWLKPLPADHDGYERHPNEWYIDQIHHGYAYHRPPVYDGRVLLLTATKICQGRLFPHDLAWASHVSGGLEQRKVPGEHEDVLQEPAVSVIGAELQALLTQLDIETRSKAPFGIP
jgi:thioesterase domain-containing protein